MQGTEARITATHRVFKLHFCLGIYFPAQKPPCGLGHPCLSWIFTILMIFEPLTKKNIVPLCHCFSYLRGTSVQRGQDKTADFKWNKTADFENETKPPISKMRQNRRFRKWDKTADFENETKPPILKWDKTADFVKENKLPSKFSVSLIKASWPNYRYLAIILPTTIRNWNTTN